ncbi:hypothetical protein [Arthrobacter sp. efr-133-R2A-63]|uniref:hypothetical protein n=1 Tax=Arthrobacter sp. efr-133-R2A-63 TaxID=3040278 RepID=UPI00254F3CF2|nr:hypothetical protein [Arthrobacter sp. efr-133-R2A-63]
MNPYRIQWINRIRFDDSLSVNAKAVAEILVSAGVCGQVALTNWQRVNRALGKSSGDLAVRHQIKELQAAGYLGRYQGNKYNQSRGWRLYLPEEESNLLEFMDQAA